MKEIYSSSVSSSLNVLFKHWDVIVERKDKIDFKFVLPNYFLVIHPELSIEKIADIVLFNIEKRKLIDFNSTIHNYVYNLSYSSEDFVEFTSFKNFYDVFVSKLSRYGETYNGLLTIDITEWVERGACNSKKFIAFLDFMSTIDDTTFTLFVSQATSEAKNKEAMQVLQTKSRIRTISLNEIADEDGVNYVVDYFNDSGFSLQKDVMDSIKKIVTFILNVDGNEGFRSLKKFVDDVIYDVVTKSQNMSKTLSNDVFERYLPNGKWANNFKNSRKKYLGIIGE